MAVIATGKLIGSKARCLAYLGIDHLREGRKSEALKTTEIAYDSATKSRVTPSFEWPAFDGHLRVFHNSPASYSIDSIDAEQKFVSAISVVHPEM